VQLVTDHNHIPEPEKTDSVLALTAMLERASICNDKPRTIMKDSQLNIKEETAPFMVRAINIRQRIQRIRRRKVDHGPNPVDLESISIPDDLTWAYGEKKEKFLFADSGYYDDDKRIIIFATASNIKLLKSTSTWYGDGTFAVCPQIFYQLYTVNVLSSGKNLPLAYILLPDKEEQTYVKMFELLLNGFQSNELPQNFGHDFEKGAINAIKTYMPETNIFGCYFHFAQSLWRQMQKKHLSNQYVTDMDLRLKFKGLKALCFVPPQDVIVAYNLLVASSTKEFIPMLKYLETYYIGKPVESRPGLRKIPSFPISFWNCYQRCINGEQKTNNSLEAWHQQFENACGKHPTLNRLIENMRLEQKNTEILIVQINTGDTYQQRLTHKTRADSIKSVAMKYQNNGLKDYIDKISLLL
jgi:hypothetical protein